MIQTEWYCNKCGVSHFGNCPTLQVTFTSSTSGEQATSTLASPESLDKHIEELLKSLVSERYSPVKETGNKMELIRQTAQSIKQFLLEYSKEQERLARIEELSGVRLEHGPYVTETFIGGKQQTIEDRLATLIKVGK